MASEKTQVSAPGKNNRTVATPQNSTIYGKAALSGLDHMQHNGYGNSVIQSMNNYHENIQLKKDEEIPEQKEYNSLKDNKTNLPNNLKSGIENLSGYSMDDVKVHYNSDKPVQLEAHAYAKGTDIHLGPGQEKHLPHEAWHVVQQKQGRVHSTTQLKSENVAVNDDKELEQEADQMGSKALTYAFHGEGESSDQSLIQRRALNQSNTARDIVQRKELSVQEKKELEELKLTANEILIDYKATKEQIKEIEGSVLCKVSDLNVFHEKIKDNLSYYDNYFTKLEEKEKEAHLSDLKFESYKKWLNGYTNSGGKNKLQSLKRFMERLNKEDTERVTIPSVFRISDYRIMIEKLYTQTSFHCKKMYLLPDITSLKSDVELLLARIEVPEVRDWNEIHALHSKISISLHNYPKWKSAVKEQFKELKLVDSKFKVSRKLLDDVGTVNVATRSDESEGYYMRSQDMHNMNLGKKKLINPFGERTLDFLDENAKVYNIGGVKMMPDKVMTQKELRRGRKKTSSSEFEGLRDDILKHKLKHVKYIVENFSKISGLCKNLKVPIAQLDGEYPCVMVLFKKDLMEKVSNNRQINISEFMTHLIAGHINAAVVRASVRPLFERRQSFGFMTPTITDVHSGVRLSLGITPSETWCDAVIQGIKNADDDIGSYPGYINIPGTSNDQEPEEVVMNKFNRGDVLGAGHKLITDKLLSEKGKNSISIRELNQLFGKREGSDVVKVIKDLKKPEFSHQEVDQDSIGLYNRLQGFYEAYLKISGNEESHDEIDWKNTDPGEKLQGFLDKSLQATYDDNKNVVGMDESSDEEDREPSRVPSGMSALFLPVAAYSSIHKDRSIVYDTAPFSYFEIDGSWKHTFKLDYIERLGVRYPMITSDLKAKALKNFELVKEGEIKTKLEPFYKENREFKKSAEQKVKEIEKRYKQSYNGIHEEEERQKLDLLKEGEIKEVNSLFSKKEKEVDEEENKLRSWYHDQKIKLGDLLNQFANRMANYMKCKEARERGEDRDFQALNQAISELKDMLAKLQSSSSEEDVTRLIAEPIVDAFESIGFEGMDKGVRSNVEVAFLDVNPCMTSEEQFDSGENLYHKTMKKYRSLRMIVIDITSSTEDQVKKVIEMFQEQSVDRDQKDIVPFLCLAKSGTKHDQLGLDISTMGRCQYIMHHSFKGVQDMEKEFANLKSTSHELSKNTEPLLVKKMRRDLRKAAKISEGSLHKVK